MRELSRRLRQRREELGLRQQDVARQVGVTTQAVSKWERGENDPDILHLPKLAELFRVTTDWLFGIDRAREETDPAVIVMFGLATARARSAELSPAAFACWSDSLARRTSDCVLRTGGEPIKCLGPGVRACFTKPTQRSDCAAAIRAVCEGTEVPLEVGVAEGRVWLGQIGHPDHAHREVMGDPVSVALALSDWVSDETVHALAWHVPASDLGVDFQERVTDLTLPGLPPLQAVGLRYGLP